VEPLQGKTFLNLIKADHGALPALSGYCFYSEISNGMTCVLKQNKKSLVIMYQSNKKKMEFLLLTVKWLSIGSIQ